MKILLAPSESKIEGGNCDFNLDNLIFKEINYVRKELLDKYLNLIKSGNLNTLSKLFGLKKKEDILKFAKDITKKPALLAVKRYSGVAFDFLDYSNLPSSAKEYINKNVLIFSNLFGVVRASDNIPLYKLKQGETIDGLKAEQVYQKVLKEPLDAYLQNEDILDIRAGYYNKFYKPSKFYTTLKFLKNGKVVSHWAKAYRGLVLKEIALNQVNSIDDFLKLNIATLEILEIKESKKNREIIYKIID